jgi:hypothetical protein
MKNKQNYANSERNLVFTTEFCESGGIEKSEIMCLTTFCTSYVVLDSDGFRKMDLSPSLRINVL